MKYFVVFGLLALSALCQAKYGFAGQNLDSFNSVPEWDQEYDDAEGYRKPENYHRIQGVLMDSTKTRAALMFKAQMDNRQYDEYTPVFDCGFFPPQLPLNPLTFEYLGGDDDEAQGLRGLGNFFKFLPVLFDFGSGNNFEDPRSFDGQYENEGGFDVQGTDGQQ
uniref:Putative secreted protein n=1 Tax=Haematobia irritans TaxID=7368 RepID=A0A1L8EB64_HAEIR